MEAIGLASGILTFISVAAKIIQISHEIHSTTAGATDENKHVATIIEDLDKATKGLKCDSQNASDEEVKHLARKCQALSSDLLALLQSLRPRKEGRLEGLKAAWSVMLKQKDIKSMETRLGQYRDQIALRLLVLIR